MTGYLTPDGKAGALNWFKTVGLYFGLAQSLGLSSPPELASISEVVTAGYSRVPVTWSTADATNTSLTNTTATQLGPVLEDMPPVAYAFLTNSPSGNVIAPPSALTLGSTGSSGGTFAAGNYYWVVTAVNNKGETIASNEVSTALTANETQALSWTAPTTPTAGGAYNVTGYNVYRGTSAGGETVKVNSSLVIGTTFTDTGAVGTAATPPIINGASVGGIFYAWELAEPVSALANKPVYVPANGLIVQ